MCGWTVSFCCIVKCSMKSLSKTRNFVLVIHGQHLSLMVIFTMHMNEELEQKLKSFS